MPFATVAVPFDAYAQLPTPQHRWLLLCLARYADRDGRCWPSMRHLAADARMSKSSVQRYLADLSKLGVFSRERKPGDRYFYRLNEGYAPRWAVKPASVPSAGRPVPSSGTVKAPLIKHQRIPSDSAMPDDRAQWQARLRSWRQSGGKFWLDAWGSKPGEAGCFIPAHLLAAQTAIP